MKWMTSMFSDSVNGSVSSKRVITFLSFVMCSVAFMVDLFTEYETKQYLFDAMMYIVVAGLGFTASEKFAPKNKEN